MTTVVKHFILTLILVVLPSAAMAQRVPATDSGAIGADGGVFGAGLSAGPTLEGFYEYYFSPRNSLRIGLGFARPEVDHQYLRVPVDLAYNWERGSMQPVWRGRTRDLLPAGQILGRRDYSGNETGGNPVRRHRAICEAPHRLLQDRGALPRGPQHHRPSRRARDQPGVQEVLLTPGSAIRVDGNTLPALVDPCGSRAQAPTRIDAIGAALAIVGGW